jgi:cytochrome c-type biogenesis protein CcmH
MSPLFLLGAGAMLALALALVLRPLLRGGGAAGARQRRLDALDRALAEGVLDEAEFGRKRKELLAEAGAAAPTRAPLVPAMLMALLLPLGSSLIYFGVGTPEAMDPAAVAAAPAASGHDDGQGGAMQMEQAIAGLEKRLEAEPDNLDGWLLLARAYKSTGRFPDSLRAAKRAFDLAPNNADVVVEYAENIALNDPGRNIAGESRALLDQVLTDDPKHQRALWLAGIAEAQVGNYIAAIARWEALKAQLPPDSEIIAEVDSQLAEARSRAGLTAAPGAPAEPAPAPPTESPTVTAATGPTLTIEVDIAPELAARLEPTDVLYVFARAAEGPRMPLALQRLPGAKFPLTVKLDDSMGMMPTLKLSSAPQVVVGARVSKSGVANAQSGDLEVISAPLSPTTQTAPLKLVISQVVP